MISVLLVLCFSQHVFRLEEQNLSSRLAMLWSSTGTLLNDVARDRIEIVVVLLKCCGTPRLLQISSTTAINYADFSEGVAIGAMKFRRILTEFEDLCLVHILQQFLRCNTEPVDLLRLTHIFQKLFFVLM